MNYQWDTERTRIGKQVVVLWFLSNRDQTDVEGTATSGELWRLQEVRVQQDSLSELLHEMLKSSPL